MLLFPTPVRRSARTSAERSLLQEQGGSIVELHELASLEEETHDFQPAKALGSVNQEVDDPQGAVPAHIEAESETSRCAKGRRAVAALLWDNHFLIGLITVTFLGIFWPTPGLAIDGPLEYISPVAVFLIAGLTMQSSEAVEALSNWYVFLCGVLVILFVVPFLSIALRALEFLDPVDLTTGLIVFVCAPTALGTVTLLTEQSEGLGLLATLFGIVTNCIGPFTSPMIMHLSVASASFDLKTLLWQLMVIVVAPTVVGNIVQRVVPSVRAALSTPRSKPIVKGITSFVILLMPWTSMSVASDTLRQLTALEAGKLILMCVALSLVFAIIGYLVALPLPSTPRVKKALVLCVGMKTVSIPLTVVKLLPPGVGNAGLMSLSVVLGFIICMTISSLLAQLLRRLPSLAFGVHMQERSFKMSTASQLSPGITVCCWPRTAAAVVPSDATAASHISCYDHTDDVKATTQCSSTAAEVGSDADLAPVVKRAASVVIPGQSGMP